jgi:aryl-alcohol dehydrogenase-like predicted oxidoreductase
MSRMEYGPLGRAAMDAGVNFIDTADVRDQRDNHPASHATS